MTISASIIDYIGKYEGGILVSVGIIQDKTFYEGIFYYTSDKMIITIDNKLKEKIGDIELHDEYIPFMESIINKVEPFNEIYDKLEDLNF
jgi:hypothetical protein